MQARLILLFGSKESILHSMTFDVYEENRQMNLYIFYVRWLQIRNYIQSTFVKTPLTAEAISYQRRCVLFGADGRVVTPDSQFTFPLQHTTLASKDQPFIRKTL